MGEIEIPKVRIIRVEELKRDGVNPNRMTFQQEQALKDNILKYGFIMPIITNEELLIADGEHRLQAAKELAMTEVPVIVLPLKEVDRKILRQVLNKLRGEHDNSLDLEEFKYLYRNEGLEELQRLLGETDTHLVQFLANEREEQPKEEKKETPLNTLRCECGKSDFKIHYQGIQYNLKETYLVQCSMCDKEYIKGEYY